MIEKYKYVNSDLFTLIDKQQLIIKNSFIRTDLVQSI